MPKSKSRPYEAGLHERLRSDSQHTVNYLKAAAEDSMDGFLLALRDVADARIGMSELAASTALNRENLYRMLSEEGNPRLESLWSILPALGLKLSLEPIDISESQPNPSVDTERKMENRISRDFSQMLGVCGFTSKFFGKSPGTVDFLKQPHTMELNSLSAAFGLPNLSSRASLLVPYGSGGIGSVPRKPQQIAALDDFQQSGTASRVAAAIL